MSSTNNHEGLTSEEIKQLRPSLKEVVDIRFTALEKAHDREFESIKKFYDAQHQADQTAISAALASMKEHLATLNEFKATFKDFGDRYVDKVGFTDWKKSIDSMIQTFNNFMTTVNAKADQKSVTMFSIIAVVGSIFGALGFILALISRIAGK